MKKKMFETFGKSNKSHNRKYTIRRNRRTRAEAELEKANTFLSKLSWQDDVLAPVAQAIAKRLEMDFEISGPFGLCAEHFIQFYPKGTDPDGDENESSPYLTIIQNGDTSCVRNYLKKTPSFPDGSIGAANGMNYESIEIPNDAGIQWFLDYLVTSESVS